MKAQLIVVENVYYQIQKPGEDAHYVKSVFTLNGESEEDPFGPRRYKVTSEPTPIQHGWVEEAMMIHIHNTGDRSIYVKDPGCPEVQSVPPTASYRSFTEDPEQVLVWADEPTEITVTSYPK